MTIRLYPSRLPGEPLETHEHRDTTIHDWMLQHVDNYRNDMVQRVTFEVNGKPVPPAEWPLCFISAESDVKVYPILVRSDGNCYRCLGSGGHRCSLGCVCADHHVEHG